MESRIADRQYWLWVTRPEYYLNENGDEREDLEPTFSNDTQGWWTCHKDTRKGDLILLWRSILKKDIGYLMQATSNAYSIAEDEFAQQRSWDYGCDYQVLFKFTPTISIYTLKHDVSLCDWSPLLQQFRRRVFSVKLEDWWKLVRLSISMQPEYKALIELLERMPLFESILLEEQLEEKIASQLSILKPFGYNLELFIDPETKCSGRQYVCRGNGGRIDLLCVDYLKDQYVVIELKNVRSGQNTFGQISNYIGYVQTRIAKGKRVIGLVISRGYDVRFETALQVTDRIFQLDLSVLGFD